MPSAAVEAAFTTRLNAWPNLSACRYVEQNEVADAPAKPPYLEIQWPVSVEERMTVGKTAVYRERGGARFVITVAAFKDGWKAQVLAWADELRDLFRGQYFDGVETQEASPAVIDERNRDGNKYHVPFVVTYTFDTIKTAST